MENLNAEQVKRGLERCANEWHCGLCGFTEKECALIKKSALSLIKKLTKENERLRDENETLKVVTNNQHAHLCDCYDNIAEMLRQKEAHTVMKMHSMLCEGRVSNDTVVIVANQIAKEMLERKYENT